jgi:transporter family-2 protein
MVRMDGLVLFASCKYAATDVAVLQSVSIGAARQVRARASFTTIAPLFFFCMGKSVNLAWYVLALCVGVAISVQAAINSQLAVGLGGNSVLSALISFTVGTVALALVVLVRGNPPGTLALLASQPLWKCAGGLLGASFVFGSVFLAPRIGLFNLVVLVIAAQLLSSMAIDQFGLVQMALRKVSGVRMLGALVMLAGVALVVFGDRLVAAMSR